MIPELPDFTPILPKTRAAAFDDPAYLFELKYDGFRGILHIPKLGPPRFYSKNLKILARFDPLARNLARQFPNQDLVLDGEIAYLDESGVPRFRELISGQTGSQIFVAFDLLYHNGRDFRRLPLMMRKIYLEKLVVGKPWMLLARSIPTCGSRLFAVVQALDLEGVVAKKKNDPYHSRAVWYKILNRTYTQKIGRGKIFNRKK